MNTPSLRLVVLVLTALALQHCTCGMPPAEPDGGTGAGATGGAGGSSTAGGAGGGTALDGGWGELADGGCGIARCGSQLYACGNCVDDDGDGLSDARDPDCLGPCHNNERGFATGIPSFGATSCNRLDCYYDTNQGFGEGCRYSHSCDPLSPSGSTCAFNANAQNCSTSSMCRTYCEPLTPAGCDCYGCCTAFLPDGGSRDIYLGSDLVNGGRQCTIATVGDPTICKACTKVAECGKGSCGPCQLCLGRTSLPPECFPPAPVDGGSSPFDAGTPGPLPDGGSLARCPMGVQACGLRTDPPCPLGGFCQTGCCVVIQ
jgi:hypothetical protein